MEEIDMRFPAIIISAFISFMVFMGTALAASVNVDSNGLALQGYDPVAYFTDDKPVKGSEEFTAEFDGAKYHFASAEHRDMFTADPAKYAPQYGGYCAYGLAFGSKAPVEVDKFKVVDGKLFLNYNADIQSRWVKDIPGFIVKANANWAAE
jgi:YHS domain-containing protein